MNKWLCSAILILAFAAVMYLLHRGGLLSAKSIRAILFVFRPGKSSDAVTLDSCTGWVSHALVLRGNGTYEFILESQLSKGSVEILLTDGKRQPVLRLSPQSPTGSAELDGKHRCRLRWEFKSASGKCYLRWRRAGKEP